MEIDKELEIDTDARTVKNLEDNSDQLQAIVSFNSIRREWLRLQPGANTLKYTESGAAGVTVDIEYYRRYYS
jgi:phage-related protein